MIAAPRDLTARTHEKEQRIEITIRRTGETRLVTTNSRPTTTHTHNVWTAVCRRMEGNSIKRNVRTSRRAAGRKQQQQQERKRRKLFHSLHQLAIDLCTWTTQCVCIIISRNPPPALMSSLFIYLFHNWKIKNSRRNQSVATGGSGGGGSFPKSVAMLQKWYLHNDNKLKTSPWTVARE